MPAAIETNVLLQSKVPSLREQWDCAKFVLLSHFTVELPQIWYVPVLDGVIFHLTFASRA